LQNCQSGNNYKRIKTCSHHASPGGGDISGEQI